jgi:hypothetical protein
MTVPALGRRSDRPAGLSLRAALAEVQRLRAQNAALGRLADLAGRLIEASDHAAELEVRRRWYRDGWGSGFAAGLAEGRRREAAERDADWRAIASPVARGGPAHAELELRRWGPGGRAHFGDPRDGDFIGQDRGES